MTNLFSNPSLEKLLATDSAVKELLDEVVVVDLAFRKLKWVPTNENVNNFREKFEEEGYLEPDDENYNEIIAGCKDIDPDFEKNRDSYHNSGVVYVERIYESEDFESTVCVTDSVGDEGLSDMSSQITRWADCDDIESLNVYITSVWEAYGSYPIYELYNQIGDALNQQFGAEGFDYYYDNIDKPIVFRSTFEESGSTSYFALDEDGNFWLEEDYDLCEKVRDFLQKLDKLNSTN